jgi:hypothetical protein
MTQEHSPPAWLLLHMPATNIDSILLFTSFHPAGLFLSGHLVVVISFDRTTQQENMLQRFLFLAFSSSTPVISVSEGGTLFLLFALYLRVRTRVCGRLYELAYYFWKAREQNINQRI